MNAAVPTTRLFAGLVAVLSVLQGCAGPGSETDHGRSPAQTYLIEYSARVEADLEQLDELEEHRSADLVLAYETRDSARKAVRGFLESIGAYQELLDRLEENLEDANAPEVREALTQSEKVHGRLKEQALHLSLLANAIDTELGGKAAGASAAPSGSAAPDTQGGRLAPSREFRQIFHRTAALAGAIDNYLSTLHQKNLVPNAQVTRPAEGVFHFLRLSALREPRLEAHSRDFDAAWKAWIQSRRKEGRFAEALGIFHLVMEAAGRYHPDSLQPLSETVQACLENPPELHVVEAMEKALEAIRSDVESLRKTPPNWKTELQRVGATLMLVRAYRTEDPGTGLSLAIKARELNPLLKERVRKFVVRTAEAIAGVYLDAEQYEGAVAAFERTLSLDGVPDRQRLTDQYRAVAFERGMKDAKQATEEARFGPARTILEQVNRLAADPSETSRARRALHAYYRAHVSHNLERDPKTAIEIAQEMIRTFPSDGRARRKLDEVLFRLLKERIGDLRTSHDRLGAGGVLEAIRITVGEMATEQGAEECHQLLREIQATWTRALEATDSAGEVFSLAVDIARVKGEPSPAARRSGSLALSRFFSRVGARRDWERIEECIDTRLSSCPSEERSADYRDVYLDFVRHLHATNVVGKLGRHLAIFTTTFPDDVPLVRDIIVERMREGTPEGFSFYALLKTVAPDSAEVKDFEREGRVNVEDVGRALRRLISDDDLAAARLQRRATPLRATPPDSSPAADLAARPDAERPPPAERGLSPASSEDQRNGESESAPAGSLVVLASTVGVAITAILLAVLTWLRGVLPFRWYAASALWLGVTAGLALGSAPGAVRLTLRAGAQRRAVDASPAGACAIISADAAGTVDWSPGVASVEGVTVNRRPGVQCSVFGVQGRKEDRRTPRFASFPISENGTANTRITS